MVSQNSANRRFDVSCIFPSNGSSSRCGPSLGKFPSHSYRSGSREPFRFERSRFPCLRYYDHTTTARYPSRSFISLSHGTGWFAPVLYRFLFASIPSEQGNSPVHLLPALSVGGILPPETLSPHTFPYDLLYICPALGPRPRWMHSLNVHPRSLPRAKR